MRRKTRPPRLQGCVYFMTGEPVMGVRVLVNEGQRVVGEVLTDARGFWSIQSDPEGTSKSRYDVSILDEHSCVLAAETVTIWGDSPFEIDVVTPEMYRDRRRREAEASQTLKTPWYRRVSRYLRKSEEGWPQ